MRADGPAAAASGRLRVGFVVQGEGRGHMTQALALARILGDAGHTLERVWVGRSPHRSVPDYFSRGIGAPVVGFDAPVQVPDRRGLGASSVGTALDGLRRTPAFVRAARMLDRGTRGLDLVVNFLDLVYAASRTLFRSEVPAVAVAHNYVFLHPNAPDGPGPAMARHAVLAWTRATMAGASTRVALAFAPGPSGDAPGAPRLAPPLLRPGLAELVPRDDGFLLAYALNPGYGDRLVRWHRAGHPDALVHCYLDGGAAALREIPGPGFHVHDLHQERFLDHLARCRAYVGSAGFESLCEAFHLGKPVLAVPTRGQHEQRLNAWDAERHGAARAGDYDDLDGFWAAPPRPDAKAVRAFRSWVAAAPAWHLHALEEAARQRR